MRKLPKQERSRLQVAAIVDATALAVSRKGLAGVSTHYVAELAGISRGSLYQYFENKEDLIEALLEKMVDDFIKLLDLQVPVITSSSLYEAVLGSIQVAAELLHSKNGVYLELVRHWNVLPIEGMSNALQKRLLEVAQIYILRNHQQYPMADLPERLFICFNSVLFTIMRLYSLDESALREERVLRGLAQMVVGFLEDQEADM